VLAKREIAEYKPALDPVRAYFHGNAGKQRGDPMKAVKAIMDVADSDNPPLHLLLGAAAWNRMKGKLEQWRTEMAQYKDVTLGADFPRAVTAWCRRWAIVFTTRFAGPGINAPHI